MLYYICDKLTISDWLLHFLKSYLKFKGQSPGPTELKAALEAVTEFCLVTKMATKGSVLLATLSNIGKA